MRRLFGRIIAVIILVAGLAFGVTQAIGSSGSSANSSAYSEGDEVTETSPYASYQEPTGPELSNEAIRAIALRVAAGADDASPVSITARSTTFAEAMRVDEPRGALQPPSSTGEANFQQSAVVLVILDGQFTLNAPTAEGRPDPSGTVLSLIIDAHTGWIDARGVAEDAPAGIAELGTVRPLT